MIRFLLKCILSATLYTFDSYTSYSKKVLTTIHATGIYVIFTSAIQLVTFCHCLHFLSHFEQPKLYNECRFAEPHSSVGSVADLRTGGRWFDPLLGNILSKD